MIDESLLSLSCLAMIFSHLWCWPRMRLQMKTNVSWIYDTIVTAKWIKLKLCSWNTMWRRSWSVNRKRLGSSYLFDWQVSGIDDQQPNYTNHYCGCAARIRISFFVLTNFKNIWLCKWMTNPQIKIRIKETWAERIHDSATGGVEIERSERVREQGGGEREALGEEWRWGLGCSTNSE